MTIGCPPGLSAVGNGLAVGVGRGGPVGGVKLWG